MMDMREILKKVPDCIYDPYNDDIENISRYIITLFILILGEKAGWWNIMTADDIKFVQECLRNMKEEISNECFDSYTWLTWDVNGMLGEVFVQIFNAYVYSYDSYDIDEESMEFLDIDNETLRKALRSFCEKDQWSPMIDSDIWVFELDPLIGYYIIHPEEFTLSKNEKIYLESVMHNLLHCSKEEEGILFDSWYRQEFVYTNEQSWYIVQLGSTESGSVKNVAFGFKMYVKYLELCDLLNKSYREGIQGISA